MMKRWSKTERALVGSSVAGAVLLIFRCILAGMPEEVGHDVILFGFTIRYTFLFLLWNLFLACIPFLLITLIEQLPDRRRFGWYSVPFWILWLLFLPNAPYVLTDFIHLRHRPPIPLWFDAGLLFLFAVTAWMFGLLAVYRAKQLVVRHIPLLIANRLVTLTFLLTAFGVLLGRVLRLNSWDALLRPQEVLESSLLLFINPLQHGETLLLGALIFGMLWMSYRLLERFPRLVKRNGE